MFFLHTNYEYELKLMLRQDEYEKLLELGCDESYCQTNYYFDTPEFALYEQKIVLRIRKKKGNCELTVKNKKSEEVENGVVSMMEKSIPIDYESAESIISGDSDIKQYISDERIMHLEPIINIGEIMTIRTNICVNKELPPAELDKSTFNCTTDYELEWEISKEEYKDAVDSLKGIGISIEGHRTGQSKYGRLVGCLRKEK